MSVKVVINTCYGGFGLSDSAEDLVEDRTGKVFCSFSHPRHCPILISVVEELGDEANGSAAQLQVVNLKGDRYIIRSYDGVEWVEEPDDIKWIKVTR